MDGKKGRHKAGEGPDFRSPYVNAQSGASGGGNGGPGLGKSLSFDVICERLTTIRNCGQVV